MAVKLRLQRGGRTNRAHFRLVAIDARTRRDGRSIEVLGHYDPVKSKDNFVCDQDRVRYWLSVGAIPSETVAQFLKKQGIELPARTKKKKKRKKTAKASSP